MKMMRMTYLLFLLLSVSGICWAQDATAVAVTLCDLYQHPEQYAGKMVKVRGGSVSELRIDDILHDSGAKPCPAYMRIVVVFPDQIKPTPGFQVVRDESYKKLLDAINSSGPIHIDATYEGRFDAAFIWRDHKRIRVGGSSQNGYGKKNEYDGQIVLRQVSEVWTVTLPHR